jgi:hypothetical protein
MILLGCSALVVLALGRPKGTPVGLADRLLLQLLPDPLVARRHAPDGPSDHHVWRT